MKLLDVNVLLYATNPEYAQVRVWFDALMNSGEKVALPWHCILGFLRISTQKTTPNPLPMSVALGYVNVWLKWESVWVPQPGPRHAEILSEFLKDKPLSRYVADAHLAALAIEHGLTICSADADFRAFSGIKFLNPLE